MTRHFSYNDPDTKPAKLADTTFWFEQLEILGGAAMFDGCVEVYVDYGEWTLDAVTIGKWTRVPYRGNVFTTDTLEFTEKRHGNFDPMWEAIRAELVRKYTDAITEACIEAAE